MTRRLTDAETVGITLGALAAITAGAILGSFRGEVSAANAAMVLVLVVLAAAYTGGARAGAATGLVAAVAFDFFLTRPYLSLAIKSTDDVVTVLLLVAIGVAVGFLASSRQRAVAASRIAHRRHGISRDRRLTAVELVDHLVPLLAAETAAS